MDAYYDVTNILQYLEQSAEKYPDKLAYRDDRESVTFREYRDAAMRIGSGLKLYGLRKAPVVLLMDGRHISQLKAAMGVVYAGCFWIPLDPAAPAERIRLIFERLRPALVICDEKGRVHRAERFLLKLMFLMTTDEDHFSFHCLIQLKLTVTGLR